MGDRPRCEQKPDEVSAAGARLRRSDSDERKMHDLDQTLDVRVLINYIRMNPQYTLAALQKGVYMIGMKDQFNIHDMQNHPLSNNIQYVADEMGFILMDKNERNGDKAGLSVDVFGPYFIEQ